MSIDGMNRRPDSLSIQFQADRNLLSSSKKRKLPQKELKDEVKFSDRSREFLRIRRLVDTQPDFRLDRVNQLAKAINGGTYSVTGTQIADAIIRKNLIDFEF